MKLINIILMLCIVSTVAFAQASRNMNPDHMYYAKSLTTANAYADSDTDTLPKAGSVWASGTDYDRVGGASAHELEITVNDSAAIDVYADYIEGTKGAWTNGLTDSLINTTNAGTTKLFTIKSNATEKHAGLNVKWRYRIAFRASGNGVSSSTYSATVNWKR